MTLNTEIILIIKREIYIFKAARLIPIGSDTRELKFSCLFSHSPKIIAGALAVIRWKGNDSFPRGSFEQVLCQIGYAICKRSGKCSFSAKYIA